MAAEGKVKKKSKAEKSMSKESPDSVKRRGTAGGLGRLGSKRGRPANLPKMAFLVVLTKSPLFGCPRRKSQSDHAAVLYIKIKENGQVGHFDFSFEGSRKEGISSEPPKW